MGRGGSDGSCCPCPHEPYSQTTKKPSYKIFYKRNRRSIPPPSPPRCSGNCCLCPPGPNSTPEPYRQTTTTQVPIKTKTPIYNFLKRGRRAIPPWARPVFSSANQCKVNWCTPNCCCPCCSYTPSSRPSYQPASPSPCSPCCSYTPSSPPGSISRSESYYSPIISDTFSCSSCSLQYFGDSRGSSYIPSYFCSSCTSRRINSISSIDSSIFSCSLSSCSPSPGDSRSSTYACSSCSNSTEGIELTLTSLRCQGESYCRLSSPRPSPPTSCPPCPLDYDYPSWPHYTGGPTKVAFENENGDWVLCVCCSDSDEDVRQNSGSCTLPFSGKFLLLFWNICVMPFLYNIFVNV